MFSTRMLEITEILEVLEFNSFVLQKRKQWVKDLKYLSSLTSGGSVGWVSSGKGKGHWFYSWPGKCLSCGIRPGQGVGAYQRQPFDVSLSHQSVSSCLSPSLPLSVKKIYIYFKVNIFPIAQQQESGLNRLLVSCLVVQCAFHLPQLPFTTLLFQRWGQRPDPLAQCQMSCSVHSLSFSFPPAPAF